MAFRPRHRTLRPLATMSWRPVYALALTLGLGNTGAMAFEIDTGNPELSLRWDNTIKYSNAFRLEKASQRLIGGVNYDTASVNYFPNTDDADRNFSRGLISNRLDLLSEFDVAWRNVGARLSGAAWYDSVYQRGSTDNTSPGTANNISTAYNQFPAATRDLLGSHAEVLDAFVYAKGKVGGMAGTVRLGKHTLLYGESLMLGANGIAAAQAPIDVVKAVAVPNAQTKEFMMPVNQISGQLQITPDVTIGAYYMLEWKGDRLPPAGSYFSPVDMLGTGGERLIVGYSPVGNVSFYREADKKGSKTGQFGAQLKFHIGEVDYGVYAVQWHDHGPSGGPILHPYAEPIVSGIGMQVGTYQWMFHEKIRAIGASFNTTIENFNIAGEASIRTNTPLASDAQVDATGTANNSDNPLYAVGRSAHVNLNWLASLGPSFLAREADFVGEIGWNRRLSITRNAAALNPNASRDSANLRMVLEPKYRQVVPGLDVSVPVGVGYGFLGNSSVVGPFLGKGVGDLSIGVNGAYLDVWRFGLTYTHYFGAAAPAVEYGHGTYKQSSADRDFVAFNVRRTF